MRMRSNAWWAIVGLFAGTCWVNSACSSSSDTGPGGGAGTNAAGGNGAPANCASRCAAVASNCSLDPNGCTQVCQTTSEKELGCMEKTCDSVAYDACVNASGGSGGTGGSAGTGGTGGTGGTAPATLACNVVAYCTSWWVVGTQVDSLPAATGGTIADGTYALVDVVAVETAWDSSVRHGLVIDGNRFLGTGYDAPSGTGTWSTNGKQVTFNATRQCLRGEDHGEFTRTTPTFEYVVDGDNLILFDDTHFYYKQEAIRVGLVYSKTTGDLCNAGGAATCTLSSDKCFCKSIQNGVLSASDCGQ